MKWIDIINSVPILISYLASGYIFIFVFQFVSPNKNSNGEISGLILKSAVASTIINYLYDLIKSKIIFLENINMLIGTCLLGVVCGYILSVLSHTKKWNTFLLRIGIKRTTYDSFWEEILDEAPWLTLYMKDENKDVLKYFGSARLYESNNPNPKIMLEQYKVYDRKGKIIDQADETPGEDQYMVIDVNDCARISVVYTKKTKSSNDQPVYFRTFHGRIVKSYPKPY